MKMTSFHRKNYLIWRPTLR